MADKVSIRETVVTPSFGGWNVQLYISDAERDSEAEANIRLTLAVQVPTIADPLFAHLQRRALVAARDEISALLQQLADEIHKAGRQI